jgi:hypothetical protein
LTDDLRLKRKQVARDMIPYLEEALRCGWQHFVTGRESLVVLDQSPHGMWCFARDNVSTVAGRGIQTQKVMFTIMWNSRGFHVVNQLPSDITIGSGYFTSNVLAPIREEFIPRDRTRYPKPLVVHMEDCSIHTSSPTQRFMSEHRMRRIPQPPYSQDLALTDFSLFPTVKNRSKRIETPWEGQPL